MDRFASILISEALNLTGGNRSSAAKLLGLSRPTLHSKIEKYHLKFETSINPIVANILDPISVWIYYTSIKVADEPRLRTSPKMNSNNLVLSNC